MPSVHFNFLHRLIAETIVVSSHQLYVFVQPYLLAFGKIPEYRPVNYRKDSFLPNSFLLRLIHTTLMKALKGRNPSAQGKAL